VEEQRAFASRLGIHYRLLSDPTRQSARVLGLPTFTADDQTFYRRLTIIGRNGRIVRVFSPVLEPEANAKEVVAWLETQSDI
jgi:peroxiredoxin